MFILSSGMFYAERSAELTEMQKQKILTFWFKKEGSSQGRQSPRSAEENFVVNGVLTGQS